MEAYGNSCGAQLRCVYDVAMLRPNLHAHGLFMRAPYRIYNVGGIYKIDLDVRLIARLEKLSKSREEELE